MRACGLLTSLLCFTLLLNGCNYEYLLIEPAEFRQTIDGDRMIDVERTPLRYSFREYHDHLLVRVGNPTGEPATLLGERSYVVDPEGESHPLRGTTIAPASFITFGLPPIVRVYDAGPRFGFGVGVGTAYNYRHHHYGHDDWFYGGSWYEPSRAYYVVDDAAYWRWKTGLAKLSLTFERPEGEHLTHEFTFERRRAE